MKNIREIENEVDRGLCKVFLYSSAITDSGIVWIYEEAGSAKLPEHLHLDYDPIWCALIALTPWWPDNTVAMVPNFEQELILLPPRIKKANNLELEKVCA